MEKQSKKILTSVAAGAAVLGTVGAMTTSANADTVQNNSSTTTTTKVSTSQETPVQAQQSKVDTTKTSVSSQQSVVNQDKSSMDSVQSKVNADSASVSSQQKVVDNDTSSVKSAQASENHYQSIKDQATPSNIAKNKADQSSQQSVVSQAQSTVSSQQKNVDSVKSSMDSAQLVVNSAKSSQQTAQNNYDSAVANQKKAEAEVSNASSAISSQKQQVANDQSQVNTDKQNISNTQSSIKSDQDNISKDQQAMNNADQTKKQAQDRLSNDQSKLSNAQNTLNNDQSKLNNVKSQLADNDVPPAFSLDGKKNNEVFWKRFLNNDNTIDGDYVFNTDSYRPGDAYNNAEQALKPSQSDDYQVDPSNLTNDQKMELSKFAAQIINEYKDEAAKYLDEAGITDEATRKRLIEHVNASNICVDLGQDLANYMTQHNDKFSNNDDQDVCDYFDNDMKSYDSNDYNYDHTTSSPLSDKFNNSNFFNHSYYTMNDLKMQIYDTILNDIFQDGQSNYYHGTDLLYSNYIGIASTNFSDSSKDYLTIIGAFDQNGKVTNDDPYMQVQTTPSISALQNQESQLQDQVNKDQQVVNDLQNQVNADKQALQSGSPEQQLQNDQKKLADDQAALQKQQQKLAMDQEKLTQDQNTLAEMQKDLSNPQAFLNDANSKVATAKAALDNANSALQSAQDKLTQATNEYNNQVSVLNSDKKALQDAQDKLSQLQQLGNDYANADSNLANAKKALQDAQDKLTKDQATLDSLKNTLSQDTQIYNAAKAKYDADLAKLKELESELSSEQTKLNNMLTPAQKRNVSFNKALDEVQYGSAKTTGGYSDYNDYQWKAGFTEPVFDGNGNFIGMMNPETGEIETIPVATKSGVQIGSVKSKSSLENKETKSLPKTGEANDTAAEVGLGLAGVLSMLGLAGTKKRRNGKHFA